MTHCKVHDVDIVADAGAVRRVVIVSEDTEAYQLAHCNLGDIGQQVVRDPLRVLADPSGRMGADGVEIPEQHDVPLRIRRVQVREDLFQHGLGAAVGIRDFSLRAVLGDRDKGRVPVDRGAGGEHDALHAVAPHAVAEDQGPGDIVVIVFQRLVDRLTHCLQAGEMNDRVDLFLFKDRVQLLPVQNADLIEPDLLSRDLRDPVQGLAAGVYQVVDDNDLIPGVQEFNTGVASDKAGAAGDKNCHDGSSSLIINGGTDGCR